MHAGSRVPDPFPVVHSPLPIAYCLLHIAYCLLPICLLPIAPRPGRHLLPLITSTHYFALLLQRIKSVKQAHEEHS
jgi:hypothetical protein